MEVKDFILYFLVIVTLTPFILELIGVISFEMLKVIGSIILNIAAILMVIAIIAIIKLSAKKPENIFPSYVVSIFRDLFVGLFVVLVFAFLYNLNDFPFIKIGLFTGGALVWWLISKIDQIRRNKKNRFIFSKWLYELALALLPASLVAILATNDHYRSLTGGILVICFILLLYYFIKRRQFFIRL